MTPAPVNPANGAVPPIFQFLGSITGRATDLYNSLTKPAVAAPSQPPRKKSVATHTGFMPPLNNSNSPLMRDFMMSPEPHPLPSLLSVPVNAPPTPPGEEYMKPKTPTQKASVAQTPALNRVALPSVANIRQQVLQLATQYSNKFMSSPLLLAGAAVVIGLAITVGRPMLEIYIQKGIHYIFNFIFYATVTAAVATSATVAWMLISGKLKSAQQAAAPVAVSVAVSPIAAGVPTPAVLSPAMNSRAALAPASVASIPSPVVTPAVRSSAATTSASGPPPPMMYPPYGYPPQQPWDEYNYPGHPPMNMNMNMYMPPTPMYQPQLYHPVPVRPFEPPQPSPVAAQNPPQPSSFPKPPTPGHARTESGNVAAIPEILQQPKKKPVYRVVQRKVEQEVVREPRIPLRTRELPPVPREPPQVPKHKGLPAVFTRFEDENSMINYASPVSEVDLKVGDHSFKPYGSPPRRYHGMNV
ncbi:hypothetical protein CKK34_6826 [Yarrowia sp. E02]|nr:hypothetical protein CKK34_6826 [Yarrowia sp. E02]